MDTPTEEALEQPTEAAESSLRMSETLKGILLRERMFFLWTCFLSVEEHPDRELSSALRFSAWSWTATKLPLFLAAMRALCLDGA